MEQCNETSIAETLAQYLSEEILEDDLDIDCDENLLIETGVDSLGMLRLVGFIESHYELKISPIYFTIENFRSINVISNFLCNLIEEKRGQANGG